MDEFFKSLSTLSLRDHDIRLPKLGLMKLAVSPAEGEGVYIMYFKKNLVKDDYKFDPESEDMESVPYCYVKVRLTELEKTLNMKMQKKILRKIDKLREWLIQQDLLLSQIQGSRREVKL